MASIQSITARQIFDSHGNPTVEDLELRVGGSDYLGKGVSKAVDNVNKIIASALIGKDPTQQSAIDNLMVQQPDGTVNEWGRCKQKLRTNAILAVSLTVYEAGASVLKIPPNLNEF